MNGPVRLMAERFAIKTMPDDAMTNDVDKSNVKTKHYQGRFVSL